MSDILSQHAGGSQHEAESNKLSNDVESNKLSNDVVSSDESESNSEDSGFGRTKGADPRGDKLEVKSDVYHSDSDTVSESDSGVPTRGAIIRSPSIKYDNNAMIHIPDVSEMEPVRVAKKNEDNSNMQMNVVEGTIHLMYLFVCDMRSLLSFVFAPLIDESEEYHDYSLQNEVMLKIPALVKAAIENIPELEEIPLNDNVEDAIDDD